MIYKATSTDYLVTGLVSGVIYGLFMGLIFGPISGIIGGIVYAILFPLVLAIASKKTEQRADLLRRTLVQTHRITCDGVAKMNGKPGWMFLCEDALVYYQNNVPQPYVLPLSQIFNVTLGMNRLIIQTQTGEYKFIVVKNKQWQSAILWSIDQIRR